MAEPVLIVARWREDVSWTDEIEGWDILIVQKDKDVPNEGRESSSYFWAFEHLYDELDPEQTVCCVQADPFDHDSRFPDNLTQVSEFTALGDWACKCDLSGRPHHQKLPIARCAQEWFGRIPEEPLCFRAGAQFLVPARKLLEVPKEWHRLMGEQMMSEPYGPWVMERLWEWWLAA